jgi:PKD repeat protein
MSHTARPHRGDWMARDVGGLMTSLLRRGVAGLASATLVAATGLLVLAAHSASAYDVAQPNIVTDNPADWTPDVVDGGVRYLAQVGSTMVAGGTFTQVKDHISNTVQNRKYVFAFDATTGQLNPNFHPTLDGAVYAIVPSADGQSVFLGGMFSHVNGVAKLGLAEVSLATGALVPSFKNPALDGRVYTVRMANNQLYVGGAFSHVGGVQILRLAAFDPLTGALNTAFHFDITGLSNPQPTQTGWVPMVTKMDIAPDGHQIAVLGNFATVNGQDRVQAFVGDLTTPTPTLSNWQTNFYKPSCNTNYESYVHDVEYSPNGSYFVIGTTGGYNKVVTVGCDSTARWESNATGSALMPTWVDHTGKDTIWSVAVTDTAVYTGGHNRWQNNPYGADTPGAGAAPRPGLSALDPVTGVPFDWNPTRTTGVGVFDLLATDQGLWIGDDTDYVGHEYHYKMAFFPLAGGKVVPQVSTGSLPTTVYQFGKLATPLQTVGSCGALALPGLNDGAIGRGFDGIAAGPNAGLTNPGLAWGQSRGAFMLSGTLYTAWADGTICRASFDGAALGTATPIDLAPAGTPNNIVTDIPKMTGMFFSNNRVYYTKTGSSGLYYHYFNPQNDMVGAYVFTASGNVSGIDFSKVGGMFLSGGKLYYVTRADGVMHRINWNGQAPVAGTAVALSGPGVDGAPSWASQALFAFAPAGVTGPNQPPVAKTTSSCSSLTCSFTSAGSYDSDGMIASYTWDFGDGATSNLAAPSHTYAGSGDYTATLTVTDNNGGSATDTQAVSVTRAPTPPVASMTSSCTHLSCSVDGTGSSDIDGSVLGWDWSFGDGATASGPTASHDYGIDGTFTITLTVTDDSGLTDTTSRTVSVSATAPGISFVGQSAVNANASSYSVKVPANVVEGDGLVLMTAGNTSSTYSAPSGSGWSLVSSKTISSNVTKVWQKVAGPADAGATVTVTGSATVKANVVLLAYRGTDPVAPVGAVAVGPPGTSAPPASTSHTTPTLAVPADGAWVVSIWTEKSSTTSLITPPAGQTPRYFGCTGGSGEMCSLLTDGGGPVSGGTTAGGVTATGNVAGAADTMWTLVLTAQS